MVDFTMSKEVNDRRSSSLPESSSSTAVNTPGVLSSRKKSRTEIMCSDVSNLIVPTGSTKKRRIEMVVAKQEEDEGGRKGIGSATAEVGGTFEDEDRIGIVKDVEEEIKQQYEKKINNLEQQIRTEKSVSKSRLDVMTNLQEEIKREKDNRMQLHKDYDAVKRSLFQEKRKQSINEKQILGLTNSLNESKQLKEDAEKYLRMMIPMMRKLLDRIVSDQIKIEEVEQANIELSNAGKIQNKKISNLKEEVGKFTAKLNELSSRF